MSGIVNQQENLVEDFLKIFCRDENTKKVMTEYIKEGLMRILNYSFDAK